MRHDKAEGENQKKAGRFHPACLGREHARRLWKKLRRYRDELLTFLDHKEVPSDNNGRQWAIRNAVLIRMWLHILKFGVWPLTSCGALRF